MEFLKVVAYALAKETAHMVRIGFYNGHYAIKRGPYPFCSVGALALNSRW